MARQLTADLLDERGIHSKWITRGEGDRMVASGSAVRIRKAGRPDFTYKLKPAVAPSTSENSSTELTPADTAALCKLADYEAIPRTRAERLVGWGLIPESILDCNRLVKGF